LEGLRFFAVPKSKIMHSEFYHKRLWAYMGLAFGFSWAIFGIAFLFFGKDMGQTVMTVVSVLFMFGPLLSTLALERFSDKKFKASSLLIRFKFNQWILLAIVLMPLYALMSFGISLIFPSVSYDPEMTGMMERFAQSFSPEELEEMKQQAEDLPIPLALLMVIQAIIAGPTINAFFAFGEELGWRAFMLRAMGKWKFWPAALFSGAIWGLWHAPLILMGHNYPEHPVMGVGMMILWCMALSPLFVYLTLVSKSSINAAIMHGTLNAAAGLAIVYAYGSDLMIGVTGLGGILVAAFLSILLIPLDRFVWKKNLIHQTIDESLEVEELDRFEDLEIK
jgi:membrane protease YdiL (CAAX protease family)